MSNPNKNKYRAALDILQKGRDVLMEELAETVIGQADELLESGFAFHEFLENQGTRLHFLCLLLSQLEQSADLLDEHQAAEAPEASVAGAAPAEAPAARSRPRPSPEPGAYEDAWSMDFPPEPPREPQPAPRKRRGRARGKKLQGQSSPEGSPEDA
jgi:hypothetical protein